jgi:hypothetical protein
MPKMRLDLGNVVLFMNLKSSSYLLLLLFDLPVVNDCTARTFYYCGVCGWVGRYLEVSDALCLWQADFRNWQQHEVID